jgi:hypothetical protein
VYFIATKGARDDFYNGVFYIQALQRLRVDQAVQIAGKVSLILLVRRATHHRVALRRVRRRVAADRHAARRSFRQHGDVRPK